MLRPTSWTMSTAHQAPLAGERVDLDLADRRRSSSSRRPGRSAGWGRSRSRACGSSPSRQARASQAWRRGLEPMVFAIRPGPRRRRSSPARAQPSFARRHRREAFAQLPAQARACRAVHVGPQAAVARRWAPSRVGGGDAHPLHIRNPVHRAVNCAILVFQAWPISRCRRGSRHRAVVEDVDQRAGLVSAAWR